MKFYEGFKYSIDGSECIITKISKSSVSKNMLATVRDEKTNKKETLSLKALKDLIDENIAIVKN